MAQYKLTEPYWDNMVYHQAGEIIELPDGVPCGRTMQPFGTGPHTLWNPPVPNWNQVQSGAPFDPWAIKAKIEETYGTGKGSK